MRKFISIDLFVICTSILVNAYIHIAESWPEKKSIEENMKTLKYFWKGNGKMSYLNTSTFYYTHVHNFKKSEKLLQKAFKSLNGLAQRWFIGWHLIVE